MKNNSAKSALPNIRDLVLSTNEMRHAILVLKSTEMYKNKDIASFVGCSPALVSKTLGNFTLTKRYHERQRTGRPNTSRRMDHASYLNKNINAVRKKTRNETLLWLNKRKNTEPISVRTLNRILKQENYRSYVVRKVPCLSPSHMKSRIKWAKKHLAKQTNFDDWIFSDECCVKIYGNSRGHYLCKRDDIKTPHHTVERTAVHEKYGAAVKIWACASSRGKCHLHIIRSKTFGAKEYVRLIRKTISRMEDHNPDYEFQQDNASIHRTKFGMSEFAKQGLNPVEWPAKSPDLSPMENVWALLKRLINMRKPHNKRTLINAVKWAWKTLSNAKVAACFTNMQLRLRRCVELDGFTI